MLDGLVYAVKADASRIATRGGMLACAGLLAAAAAILLSIAIFFALVPEIGEALSMLCAAGFLFLLAGIIMFIANAKGKKYRMARRMAARRTAAAADVGTVGAGAATAGVSALLANGLAAGMLEKQLRSHPMRMIAAALAAGTVMGVMEGQFGGSDDKGSDDEDD